MLGISKADASIRMSDGNVKKKKRFGFLKPTLNDKMYTFLGKFYGFSLPRPHPNIQFLASNLVYICLMVSIPFPTLPLPKLGSVLQSRRYSVKYSNEWQRLYLHDQVQMQTDYYFIETLGPILLFFAIKLSHGQSHIFTFLNLTKEVLKS